MLSNLYLYLLMSQAVYYYFILIAFVRSLTSSLMILSIVSCSGFPHKNNILVRWSISDAQMLRLQSTKRTQACTLDIKSMLIQSCYIHVFILINRGQWPRTVGFGWSKKQLTWTAANQSLCNKQWNISPELAALHVTALQIQPNIINSWTTVTYQYQWSLLTDSEDIFCMNSWLGVPSTSMIKFNWWISVSSIKVESKQGHIYKLHCNANKI